MEIIVGGGGLRGEALRTKEHAETGSSGKGEEDPRGYICWLTEGDEEAHAEGCEEPSDPEWGPVATGPSDYKADGGGGGRDGEGEGEDSDAGGDRRVVFRNLEVEGHVVEERPWMCLPSLARN